MAAQPQPATHSGGGVESPSCRCEAALHLATQSKFNPLPAQPSLIHYHSGPVCRIFATIQTNTIRIARASQFGRSDQGFGLPRCKTRQSGSSTLQEGTRTRLSLIAAGTRGSSRSRNPDRGIFEGGSKIRQAGSSDLRCPIKIRQSGSPYL